jgi:SAM-dependent methyltransferase
MGLDITALNFLNLIVKKKLLGNCITLGRQTLNLHSTTIKKTLNIKSEYVHNNYCEDLLLKYFGASNVESLDFSDFEQATHIVDLNLPLPKKYHGIYDTVINFGTLEHIFNISEALKSCSALCKKGGQILHVLPSNNFCGHGFYQFSPELFFSLYSEKNGHAETEVFLSDITDNNFIYKVNIPKIGSRINLFSFNSLYVLCRTVFIENKLLDLNVQQSDYLYSWNKSKQEIFNSSFYEEPLTIKEKLKKYYFFYRFLNFINNLFKLVGLKKRSRLNKKNEDIKIIKIIK